MICKNYGFVGGDCIQQATDSKSWIHCWTQKEEYQASRGILQILKWYLINWKEMEMTDWTPPPPPTYELFWLSSNYLNDWFTLYLSLALLRRPSDTLKIGAFWSLGQDTCPSLWSSTSQRAKTQRSLWVSRSRSPE